jgi:hypothetical protein
MASQALYDPKMQQALNRASHMNKVRLNSRQIEHFQGTQNSDETSLLQMVMQLTCSFHTFTLWAQ